MNGVQTLPRLSGEVPQTITTLAAHGENAKLARYLVASGALRASDVPVQWSDPLSVCQLAMDRWVRRHVGPLRCLSPVLWLEALKTSEHFSKQSNNADRYDAVRLAWTTEATQWPVGAGLEGLERWLPGLGATALNTLSRRSNWIVPLFTPVAAEYWAEYVYWYGETDEGSALEESCGDDEDAKAAMRADMVTRAKLDTAYPAWALHPWKHRLSRAALRDALKTTLSAAHASGRHVPMAEVIGDLLRLDALKVNDDYQPDADGEFVGFAAVLSWREDDITVRIFDDGMNLATQAEYCDIAGEHEVSLADPDAMRAWLKSMRRRLKVMALVDRLIWRLAHPDWLDSAGNAPTGTSTNTLPEVPTQDRQSHQEADHALSEI